MEKPEKSLLIILYRNPEMGKVKTRLAATLGKEKALEIFKKLALHTKMITQGVPVDKIVFYSHSIDLMDIWSNAIYLKALQKGDDLGERMRDAFASGFESGYHSICIIGTDCFELQTHAIQRAFEALKSVDAVIGPARDGGYYLLGMQRFYPAFFRNKQWSTETVFHDTVRDFESLGLNYMKLETLRDVDTEADLPEEWSDL